MNENHIVYILLCYTIRLSPIFRKKPHIKHQLHIYYFHLWLEFLIHFLCSTIFIFFVCGVSITSVNKLIQIIGVFYWISTISELYIIITSLNFAQTWFSICTLFLKKTIIISFLIKLFMVNNNWLWFNYDQSYNCGV